MSQSFRGLTSLPVLQVNLVFPLLDASVSKLPFEITQNTFVFCAPWPLRSPSSWQCQGQTFSKQCAFPTGAVAIPEAAWGLPASPPKPWAPRGTPGFPDALSSWLSPTHSPGSPQPPHSLPGHQSLSRPKIWFNGTGTAHKDKGNCKGQGDTPVAGRWR